MFVLIKNMYLVGKINGVSWYEFAYLKSNLRPHKLVANRLRNLDSQFLKVIIGQDDFVAYLKGFSRYLPEKTWGK